MKALLAAHPFQRAILSLTVGLMSGLLTISAGQLAADIANGSGPRTVHFVSTDH